MPAISIVTIYTNDGTEVLGSIHLVEVSVEGYTVKVNDVGLSGTDLPEQGYIYNGPGKWLGVSKSPNTATAEYGPGTSFFTEVSINVYAVIGVIKPAINIDLSTLSGYQALANGTYSLTVKAKATGYTDSDLSDSVSITKF